MVRPQRRETPVQTVRTRLEPSAPHDRGAGIAFVRPDPARWRPALRAPILGFPLAVASQLLGARFSSVHRRTSTKERAMKNKRSAVLTAGGGGGPLLAGGGGGGGSLGGGGRPAGAGRRRARRGGGRP